MNVDEAEEIEADERGGWAPADPQDLAVARAAGPRLVASAAVALAWLFYPALAIVLGSGWPQTLHDYVACFWPAFCSAVGAWFVSRIASSGVAAITVIAVCMLSPLSMLDWGYLYANLLGFPFLAAVFFVIPLAVGRRALRRRMHHDDSDAMKPSHHIQTTV